jgi:hypothetical protein
LAIGDYALLEKKILSPQSTGDLIGRAVRVYRANLREWAMILLAPTICVLFGRVINQYCFVTLQKGTSLEAPLASIGLGLGVIVVIIGKWWLVQKQLALVRLANGFSETLDDAVVYMGSRRWSLAGLTLLVAVIAVAVTTLWMFEVIASGILIKFAPLVGSLATIFGVFGMFVSTIFIIFAMMLAFSALACEKRSATEILSRGFTMASKYFFRTMLCGVVIQLTVYFIAMPLWSPVMVIGVIDYLRVGPTLAAQGLPMHWQVFVAAWETVVEMITQPIMSLAYGFYYYDLRLRNEGVDVLESIEALKLKQNALSDIQ